MKKIAVVTFELEENERIDEVAEKLKGLIGVQNVGYGIIQGAQAIKWPKKQEDPWKTKLRGILSDLGVSLHLTGYEILFCALEYLATIGTEKVRIQNIYNYVYENLKVEYNLADRNIRYVIKNILSHNSLDKISSVLGTQIGSVKLTPSNFFILLKEAVFG